MDEVNKKINSLNDMSPYELIIDSLIHDSQKDVNTTFMDGLLVSDLLLEAYGAESVVTTKAFQSDHAKTEIEEESLEQRQLLQDLVLAQKQTSSSSSSSTLSTDIFDEPDVDYSRELSENAGPVPSHSINLDTKTKKKRKVWSHSQIVARMPPTSQTFMDPNVLISCLEESLELSSTQSLQYDIRPINEEEEKKVDWCKEVQKSWPPSLLAEDILITLPFHTRQDCLDTLKRNRSENKNETESMMKDPFDTIVIEGGSAFGTGDHPTSRMCSEWLLKECSFSSEQDNNNDLLRVMDYGSGSGILAFIALLSAKRQNKLQNIRVDGVEVDAIAIDSARRNTLLNGFDLATINTDTDTNCENEKDAGVQFYGPMEGTPGSELWDEITGKAKDQEVPKTLLPASRIGSYDVLIANILAQPLISLVRTLAMLLQRGTGRLALSGLVEDQVECVLEAYKPYFDDIHVVRKNKGWVLLEGTRNREPSQHPLDTNK